MIKMKSRYFNPSPIITRGAKRKGIGIFDVLLYGFLLAVGWLLANGLVKLISNWIKGGN
jgi:hypothetical protein